ncbi:hypothetical protein LPB79_22245 [Rhizobium sp. T136]|nr:hypothetical protein LPB79_22245 [Rhizobium sp. T136]
MIFTTPGDLTEALAPLSQIDRSSAPVAARGRSFDTAAGDPDRSLIVDALGPTSVEVDDVIRHTSLPAPSVYLALLELTIAG